jgi:hypothetical protein
MGNNSPPRPQAKFEIKSGGGISLSFPPPFSIPVFSDED